MSLFDDRSHAGREVSNFLKGKAEVDLVVIPYAGALDIGLEIAKTHNADVEILLSDFISAEDIPYADVGAVVEDGTIWVEDQLVDELDVNRSYIEESAELTSSSLGSNSVGLNQNTSLKPNGAVVIASEGLGSGFREAAVAGSLLKKGFGEVHLVAPFKSRSVMADIEKVVDEVFYLNEIPFLSSPDSCYEKNHKGLEIEDYNMQLIR